MSQTKVFSVSIDTVRRTKDDGSGGQGCGKSKHLYVGRSGSSGSSRNYDSFIKFNLDWTGVRKIVSATLNLYTDEYDAFGSAGEPGVMGQPLPADNPKIVIYRLTSAFTQGNNVDGHFDSTDYVNPAHTTSGGVSKVITPLGADLLHTIDVTALVRLWAPATVEGGGKKPNYGFGLYGTNATAENWSGWSNEHVGGGGASERPTITLVYELGPTVPNVPANLTPSGSVASLLDFEADFSDVRPTDYLVSTDVQVYAPDRSGTAAASTDRVTSAAHGLKDLDIVYFTSLTGGTGIVAFTPYYVRNSTSTTFQLSAGPTSGIENFTVDYSALKWTSLSLSITHKASESERDNDHFIVPKPDTFVPTRGVTYHWRARYTDQEGQVSAWSSLASFTLTNNPPNAPTLTPADGSTVNDLNLRPFSGTFTDPDAGDVIQGHQVQLSPFASGDVRWDEADGIIWDSGKVFAVLGDTSWKELYGGPGLVAGTYYWRARVWDQHDGVSSWSYARIVLTVDFNPDPTTQPVGTPVGIDPHAPWRILIRNLYQADGVTKTVGRAPGQLVAVFEEAKSVGASIVYNSPGELHFTLLKDDEQISVVEPKQVHYAVEFYSGNGWVEKFAGVIWDTDATDTDAVFKGIDYLALFDTVIDERYDPLKPNKSYASGGSYYSNVTISTVVTDQLTRAHGLTDSWVGFISIGSIAAMNEKVTVYSTMQPTLSFIAGLIDSHRQGTGKRTRIKVTKTTGGTYSVSVVDDPGQIRDDLALHYGELVQGYRIIVFGDGWANVEHVVGRNRDGVKVVYQTVSGQPFQPSTSLYGRIATVAVMDGVQDQSDLNRRGLQAAIQSAKLGKNIALGLRVQYLSPLSGWDVTDVFPVKIDDGAIDTDNFGSGYWAAYAAAWEATDIGEQSLVITLMPREDASSPNPDLIPSRPISPQAEWQLGWVPPDPIIDSVTANALRLSLDTGFFMDAALLMDAAYSIQGHGNIFFDVKTGKSYELLDDGTWALVGGPPTILRPQAATVKSRSVLNKDGSAVVNISVGVTA